LAAKTAVTEEGLAVRYFDWIAHRGRRTPDKTALVDLASEVCSSGNIHTRRNFSVPAATDLASAKAS
jgi:hypothetical protein